MLKSTPMLLRRVALLAVLTVLVLGGVASLLIFAPSRSADAQGGSGGAVKFACDHPPPEIFGWPIV